MTVPSVHDDTATNFPLLIVCLVSDKKYRKMGGNEGLRGALKPTGNRNICIAQIPTEELLLNSNDFEATLKHFIRENSISASNLNVLDKSVILVHKYSDFYKLAIDKMHVDRLRSWLHDMTSVIKVLDDPERIDILSDRVVQAI